MYSTTVQVESIIFYVLGDISPHVQHLNAMLVFLRSIESFFVALANEIWQNIWNNDASQSSQSATAMLLPVVILNS